MFYVLKLTELNQTQTDSTEPSFINEGPVVSALPLAKPRVARQMGLTRLPQNVSEMHL
jgi:hypothetical protein